MKPFCDETQPWDEIDRLTPEEQDTIKALLKSGSLDPLQKEALYKLCRIYEDIADDMPVETDCDDPDYDEEGD